MVSPPKMGNQPTFRDVAHRGPPVMDQVPTTEISKQNQAKDFLEGPQCGLRIIQAKQIKVLQGHNVVSK